MPISHLRRRAALLALLCAVPVAAAGCGGADGGAGAIDDIAGAVGGDETASAVRISSAVQQHAEELRAAAADLQDQVQGSKKWKKAMNRMADAADAAATQIEGLDADGAGKTLRDQAALGFRELAKACRAAAKDPKGSTGFDPSALIPAG